MSLLTIYDILNRIPICRNNIKDPNTYGKTREFKHPFRSYLNEFRVFSTFTSPGVL